MKPFRVYSKPSKKLIAIEQKDWSWPAFFLTSIWGIFNRLWLVSIISTVVYFLLEFFLGRSTEYYSFQQPAYWMGALFVSVLFGLRGKEWREEKLLKRGYEPTFIEAESRELAILKFKSQSTDEETNKPQESVVSMSKDLIKRKIQESASSDKKKKSDYVEELKEAKALLDDDLINEEDYEKIKKKIIEDL